MTNIVGLITLVQSYIKSILSQYTDALFFVISLLGVESILPKNTRFFPYIHKEVSHEIS